jgi:uncharacterized membrane protein
MIYAAAQYRRGEISDAIVAHMVTNALLAAYVLIFGHWAFWRSLFIGCIPAQAHHGYCVRSMSSTTVP